MLIVHGAVRARCLVSDGMTMMRKEAIAPVLVDAERFGGEEAQAELRTVFVDDVFDGDELSDERVAARVESRQNLRRHE